MADVNPLAYRFHLADIDRAARPRPRALPRPAPPLAARLRATIRELSPRRPAPARLAPPSQPA